MDTDFREVRHQLIKRDCAGLIFIHLREPESEFRIHISRRLQPFPHEKKLTTAKRHADDLAGTSEGQPCRNFEQQPLPEAQCRPCQPNKGV